MKIQQLLLAALLFVVPLAAEDSFTLAVVPDAQQETSGSRFGNRMTWLVNNRSALNLKAMFQVGDLQNWDTPTHDQYVHQSAGISILDNAGLPHVLCQGNHDTAATMEGGSAAPGNVNTNLRNTTTFNAYYPVSRFAMLRGVYEAGKMDNAWHTFSAGGLDWLVINLELWARTGAVDWAKGVVAAHPNHNIIFVTHAHLDGGSGIQQDNGGYGNNSPQYVFNQAMKPYANVRLVFSGHAGVHAYRTDVGTNGNTIYQFKQCYHSNTDNPTRLFTIDTKAGTIRTWVYGQTSNTTYSDGSAFTVSGVSWVQPAAVKPAITTQPAGKTVSAGQSVSFTVAASGSAPLTYQWKRGGTVVGGNSATLSLASAQAADAGSYTCTVSNSAGSATSNAAVLAVNQPAGAGWQASYYDNRDFTGTRIQRIDAAIAFDWGTGAPMAGIGADTFSVRWRGVVTARASGTWTFTATADDGVRVWVGGQKIIDRWVDQAATEVAGQAVLTAGTATEVVMEYYENAGSAVAKLDWSGPGQARTAVPTTAAGNGDDLPGGWSPRTVGSPSQPGTVAESGGVWTITATGVDIWGAADAGTMAGQLVTGDVRITAKVLSVGETNAWAKAGVMIRETGAAGSRHAFTCVTPGCGVAFQRRLATDGTSSHTAGPWATAPYWVRVERIGDVLIGSCSPDGATWTEIRRETIAMAAVVRVGLAVSAHNDAATCTVTFSDVRVVAAIPTAN